MSVDGSANRCRTGVNNASRNAPPREGPAVSVLYSEYSTVLYRTEWLPRLPVLLAHPSESDRRLEQRTTGVIPSVVLQVITVPYSIYMAKPDELPTISQSVSQSVRCSQSAGWACLFGLSARRPGNCPVSQPVSQPTSHEQTNKQTNKTNKQTKQTNKARAVMCDLQSQICPF